MVQVYIIIVWYYIIGSYILITLLASEVPVNRRNYHRSCETTYKFTKISGQGAENPIVSIAVFDLTPAQQFGCTFVSPMGKKKKHSGEIYLTPRKGEAGQPSDDEEKAEKARDTIHDAFSGIREETKEGGGEAMHDGEEIVVADSAAAPLLEVESGETGVEKNIYTGHGLGKKIKFVGEYEANNSGKPMDVQTVSYSASHLILGENGHHSLLKFRKCAKAVVAAGRLTKGSALQQRWYKSISNELGGRPVREATIEELVYIAKRENIPIPKRGSLYGYVNVFVSKVRKISFDNPIGFVVGLFGWKKPSVSISVRKRSPVSLGACKGMFFTRVRGQEKPEHIEVHDKYVEDVVVQVYRGERLVGEGFSKVNLASENPSGVLEHSAKIKIYASKDLAKGKWQKLYDRIFRYRGDVNINYTYDKSAAEELGGLSYRRALINAIGLPISDLPRNLDRKKELKALGIKLNKKKNSDMRWGKLRANYTPQVDNHRSKSAATIVPVLNFPTR